MNYLRKTINTKVTAGGGAQLWNIPIPRRVLAVLSLIAVIATLVAGLWPFCAPKNEVAWLKGGNGVRFGEHGTALSSDELNLGGAENGPCSLELWVQRERIWTTGTVVAFYRSLDHRQFAVQQDFADLVLQLGRGQQAFSDNLRVKGVFRKPDTFIAITSDGRTTSIYVNGQSALTLLDYPLTSKDLSGQLILANSPLLDSSWAGQMKGLAIYSHALPAEQVLRDYQEWTQLGETAPASDWEAVAMYRFGEHEGRLIQSSTPTGPNLKVPERFQVVDQMRFESPVTEFRTQWNYWDNVQINIIGFFPLGFVLAAYFTAVLKAKPAAVLAVIGGMAVSFAIEYFQSFLPTRYSGWTDIFTNTIGTGLGVLLYRVATRFVSFHSANSAIRNCR